MSHDPAELSGPDFLDAVANAERAQGNEINAVAYERRANEWRQLHRDHDRALQRVAELSGQLARIQKAANESIPVRRVINGSNPINQSDEE